MNKLIITFIIFIFSLSISAQSKDCIDIKNGSFKYLDSQSNEFIVQRRDSIQVDSCKSVNFVIHSKINWKSDCEYEMTIYKVNDTLYNPIIGKTFEFKIIKIENDSIRLITKTLNKERETERIMHILN
jgi:hypothetical protein